MKFTFSCARWLTWYEDNFIWEMFARLHLIVKNNWLTLQWLTTLRALRQALAALYKFIKIIWNKEQSGSVIIKMIFGDVDIFFLFFNRNIKGTMFTWIHFSIITGWHPKGWPFYNYINRQYVPLISSLK